MSNLGLEVLNKREYTGNLSDDVISEMVSLLIASLKFPDDFVWINTVERCDHCRAKIGLGYAIKARAEADNMFKGTLFSRKKLFISVLLNRWRWLVPGILARSPVNTDDGKKVATNCGVSFFRFIQRER